MKVTTSRDIGDIVFLLYSNKVRKAIVCRIDIKTQYTQKPIVSDVIVPSVTLTYYLGLIRRNNNNYSPDMNNQIELTDHIQVFNSMPELLQSLVDNFEINYNYE